MKKQNQVIGTESYYNSRTGELIEMQLVETDVYEKDSNFHKVFLKDFIGALSSVADSKTRLCYWILTHMTRDNLLLFTYREIAAKTGLSYGTVADTMKKLLAADFLRKNNSGHYIVNPNMIFKGSLKRRCIALETYQNSEPNSAVLQDELRLRNIQKDISRLRRQEERIKKSLAHSDQADQKN